MCECVDTDPAWEGWEHWYFGQDEAPCEAVEDLPPVAPRLAQRAEAAPLQEPVLH
jgi:hypothetical protein